MMGFGTIFLLAIATWLAWHTIKMGGKVVDRWKNGLFRFSLATSLMTLVFLAGTVLMGWAAYETVMVSDGYDRAGAENVEYIGRRDGFPNPLVAYNNGDGNSFCLGERVGGEEYLNELVCLDPQEPRD